MPPDQSASRRVPRSFFSKGTKGRDVGLLHVTLRNRLGALAIIINLLTNNGVNILSGYHEIPNESEAGHWDSFVGLSSAQVPFQEIVESIRKLDSVIEVSAEPPSDLLIDAKHFPLIENGERIIAFMAKSFIDMEKSLLGVMGKAGETALYVGGRAAGKTTANMLKAWGAMTKEQVLELVCKSCLSHGLADGKIQEFDETSGSVRVILHDSVEASMYSERQSAPVCHFIRGMISGVLEEMFGRKTDAKETQCAAMGAPDCVIEAATVPITVSKQ